MGALAKPDSSYASIRMTRRNAPRRHLLSNFNKPEPENTRTEVASTNFNVVQPFTETKPDVDTDAEPLSSEEEEAEESQPNDVVQPSIEINSDIDTDADPLSYDEEQTEKTEPDVAQPSIETKSDIDTDAEPLSSEEEQISDNESLPGRKESKYATTTLAEKLAEEKNGSQASPQVRSGSFRRSGPARTLSAMMGSDDEDGPLFSSGSSQSYKRQRATKYSSKTSYFNRPPFPPRPVVKTREPSPAVESPKEPEETFIVPKEIGTSSFKESRGGEESNSSFSYGPFSMEEYEAMLLGDDSPLSSPSPSLCEEMSQLDEFGAKEPRQPSPPPKALCPLCHEEVEWALLERFKAQPKQRIREQVQFCERHQLRSALLLWIERGYPTIDWKNFEERIQSYFPRLEKFLVPGAFSYYRNMLDASFTPGQAKNFRLRAEDGKGLENMTCGYYGPLGATKMLEVVIRRFSVLVRRLALSDPMIKAVGVAGYTQSVLVPELAVLMVKDDMKVNDEDARQILRESMEIGGRVNPDHNVVEVPEEENDEKEES